MLPLPRFRGPLKLRRRCARVVANAISSATARRLRHGPTLPSWNWAVELGTAVLREELLAAYKSHDVTEQRAFLDVLVVGAHLPDGTSITEVEEGNIRGRWILPEERHPLTMLYLHGGGFAVYPRESYTHVIATLASYGRVSTFAPDYRLAPECPFPAALEDARAAYLWLLDSGIPSSQLIVAGDSAGGNLSIVLLCDLRDSGLPLPRLAIALSPATEFDRIRGSMSANAPYDWITGEIALTWRDWYCREDERSNPLVSPIHADLRGLPPIYIQAGQAEILYDSISAFAQVAKEQGADVTLESWADMNHVFQFLGADAPQSAEALQRMRERVAQILMPVVHR